MIRNIDAYNLCILNTWNELICFFQIVIWQKKQHVNLECSIWAFRTSFNNCAFPPLRLRWLPWRACSTFSGNEVMKWCTCLQPFPTTHQRLSGPSGMESAICWWHLLSHSCRIGCPFWTSDCSTKPCNSSDSKPCKAIQSTDFYCTTHFFNIAPLYSDTNWQPWHLMELVHVELDDHSAGPWEKPKNFVAEFGGTGSFC